MRRLPPAYSPLRGGAILRSLLATDGKALTRVASRIASTVGGASVYLLDSGTSSLGLALRAACGPGGTAVLPAFGCYDLATAAVGAGVRVRLYDVDPATLGPDWESLGSALADGAQALVVVHLFGVPVDIDRAAALAGQHGALLVEDAAQGIGGSWRARPLGSHGALGVLSFGRGKGRTGGTGGALLVNDPSLLPRAERETAGILPAAGALRPLALAVAQWALGRPALYAIPAALPGTGLGETSYHVPWAPRGMPSRCAALLDAQWDAAEAEALRRRRNVGWLLERVPRVRERVPGLDAGDEAGWLRLPVLEPEPGRLLSAPLGIVRSYPRPLSRLPQLGPSLAVRGDFPGAERLAATLCTVPVHGLLAQADLERIAQWLHHRLGDSGQS